MNLRTYLFSVKQYLLNRSTCHQLKKFKNIHKGQRCFIIGTGPSLTVEDLELLKDEICFGSNRIFEIYPRTSWRPTYYEKGIPVMNEGTQDYFKGAKASNQGLNLPRVVESTVAYMTARKYADRHPDFTVYNATRGGKLEAFERVKLEDVLAKKVR